MTGSSTEAASMETSAGIPKVAAGVLGPVEAEMFSIGGKQGISTLGQGSNGGSFLSSSGDFNFAVGWEVT